MFLMVVSVPVNQVHELCTMYMYRDITVSSNCRCSLPVDSVMLCTQTHTHTGWLSYCLQNSVRIICLSFWACAVTLHGTQKILEVLCKCERSANTRKIFGRRVREYAKDTCLPHSRNTTVVHKLCDTSSVKTEVYELLLSWSEWWKSRLYTIYTILVLSLPSGEAWFRLGVISKDRVAHIKLLSGISETTNFTPICDRHSDTVRWTPVQLRENLRLFAARRFFISLHRTSRLIKLSEMILPQGEPETWSIF